MIIKISSPTNRLIKLSILILAVLVLGIYIFIFHGHRYGTYSSLMSVSLIFISSACLYFFWVDLEIKSSFGKNLADWTILLSSTTVIFLALQNLERAYIKSEIESSNLWSIGEVVHVAHVRNRATKGPRFVVIRYLANGRDYLQKSFDDTLGLGDKIHLKCAADDPSMVEIMARKSKAAK